MLQNVRGTFVLAASRRGRRALRMAAVAAAAAIVAAACGSSTSTPPTFGLAIQNRADRTVKLDVVVGPDQRPAESLVIPARSGLLETADAAMVLASGKPVDVVVELYTENCALLRKASVGPGRTLVVVNADLTLTMSSTSAPGGAPLTPEMAPAC